MTPTEIIGEMMRFQYDDGGRSESGRRGKAGDCVTRAIAIATGQPYDDVYRAIAREVKQVTGRRSARNGVPKKTAKDYMRSLGWQWTPTMHIGQGCKVHLRADELPPGRVIACVSQHWVAVIDGVVHDTYDPSRNGTRCVYGYWTP